MFRPRKKKLLKFAVLLIIVSVTLFSYSVYSIEQGITKQTNVTIGSGSVHTIKKINVSAGDDLEYSINSQGSRINVSAFLISPDNSNVGYLNVSDYSGSKVIVTTSSGNWTLFIKNNGNSQIVVDISLGDISYLTLVSTIFGFVLLPSGIALLIIYSYARVKERKREKLRDFSQ